MKNNFRLDLAKEMDHSLGSILGDDLMFSVANGKSEAEKLFCPRSNSLAMIEARPIFMIANLHFSSMLSCWYGEQTENGS